MLKIGIEVDVFDHTNWAHIAPRTWEYTGHYPIPSYAEGGYDILFTNWIWDLNWNPIGFYDSPAITPYGNNFYQYFDPQIDWAISNYTQSFIFLDRIEWCEEIQEILYENQPSITIAYPEAVYIFDNDFTGWDGLLWSSVFQPMVEWTISGETEFHYASPAVFEDFHVMTYKLINDAQWLHQIYNGLVESDPELSNVYGPWLAESFSSSDGLTFNVVIKNTAVWADGTPITTDDIIYNYQLAVSPALGGSDYYTNIMYWNNNSITKISDTEFNIEFLQPYVFQEGNLGLDLIPKHLWEAVDPADHQATATDWAVNHPEYLFGAGPYLLENYDATNAIIHLTKNPRFADWYGSEPGFEDVYFEFYSSKEGALAGLAAGDIDMVDAQFSPQLDDLGIPETTYEIINYPGVTACPPTDIAFDDSLEVYSYDINQALYHMEQAGFEVEYTTSDPVTTFPTTPLPITTPPPSTTPTTTLPENTTTTPSTLITSGFTFISTILGSISFTILVNKLKKKLR